MNLLPIRWGVYPQRHSRWYGSGPTVLRVQKVPAMPLLGAYHWDSYVSSYRSREPTHSCRMLGRRLRWHQASGPEA